MYFAYRSVADLNGDVTHGLADLPRDCDLVVGIPRDGLLVAQPARPAPQLPVTDLQGLLKSRLISAGQRLELPGPNFLSSPRRVIVSATR